MPTNTKRSRSKIKTIDKRSAAPAESNPEDQEVAPVEVAPEPDPPAPVELVPQVDKDFNPFEGGLTRYCREGRFQPLGGSVLAYGIMPGDHNFLGLGKEGENLGQGLFDTRKAIAWEVSAVGPDVPRGYLQVGQCFKHLSATAAPVDGQDKSCRWHIIWYADVIGAVWPDEEVEVEDSVTGEISIEVRPREPEEGADEPEAVVHVTGAYPWVAEQENGKAWRVVDGDGDLIANSISQAKAEMIADRVNQKAAMRSIAPEQHAGITIAEADRPTPIRTPSLPQEQDVDFAHLLEGLGAEEAGTMMEVLRQGDLKSAEAIYPNLLKMSQNRAAVEDVSRRTDTNISHLPGEVQATIRSLESTMGVEAALDYKQNWEDQNLEKKKSTTVARSPSTPRRRRTSSR